MEIQTRQARRSRRERPRLAAHRVQSRRRQIILNWNAMFNSFLKSARAFLALSCVAVLSTAAIAADQPQREYSVSDTTGEQLAKYKEALDAKNYDGALAILDAQIPKVAAGSYDLAFLQQIKAQTFMQKGEFQKAIEPLEQAVSLSDSKTPTFFEDRQVREFMYLLAQLYYQEATGTKNVSVAASFFEKADKAFVRWLKLTPKPTADALQLHSQILYSWATQDAEHPNLDLVKRALEQVEFG